MWTKILVLNLDVRVVFSTLQHSTTSISNITWNIIFKTIKTIFPSHLFCAHVDCLLNSVKVKAVKAEEFHFSIDWIGFFLLQTGNGKTTLQCLLSGQWDHQVLLKKKNFYQNLISRTKKFGQKIWKWTLAWCTLWVEKIGSGWKKLGKTNFGWKNWSGKFGAITSLHDKVFMIHISPLEAPSLSIASIVPVTWWSKNMLCDSLYSVCKATVVKQGSIKC